MNILLFNCVKNSMLSCMIIQNKNMTSQGHLVINYMTSQGHLVALIALYYYFIVINYMIIKKNKNITSQGHLVIFLNLDIRSIHV